MGRAAFVLPINTSTCLQTHLTTVSLSHLRLSKITMMLGAIVILFCTTLLFLTLVPGLNLVGNAIVAAVAGMPGETQVDAYISNIFITVQAAFAIIDIVTFVFIFLIPWLHEYDSGMVPQGGAIY